MASCFLPKNSSAATARLAGLDRDADAAPFPSPSASESKSQSQPKRGQRRSSPAAAPGGSNADNAPSADEDAVDLTDSSSDDSDAESNESSQGGSSNDSVASDATTASHDDYASLGEGGDDGGATTAAIWEEYDGGDLRTLNRLVNKLHAAELRRERRRKHYDDADCADDLPSALPPPGTPPRFSPLHTPHGLSVSSVESWRGPSLEVVPTECVDGIMPLWRSEWTRDRAEWEERRRIVDVEQLRRSRTHDGRRASSSSSAAVVVVVGAAANGNGGPAAYGFGRRNNSLPTNALLFAAATRDVKDAGVERAGSAASGAASTNRHYRYGRPPSLPRGNDPNPMVRKSSKKINKKHARYALCAGMMLGIREGVGGALGVEAELGISNWEGLEHSWEEGGGEEEEEEEVEDGEGGAEGEEGSEIVLLNGSKTDGSSSSPSRRPRSNDPSSSSSSHENLAAVAATLTAECERVAKYKFPPHQFYLGSNTSKPLPHKYKFKVYAPLVFARIRSLFGVEKQTFLHSICGKFNFYEFASNARSGQFFFYSHDGRYMIKTLTFAESKFLREILPFYYRHLTRYPSTFLTHFYGMYRVCMPNAGNQRLHFMIMRSVFHTKKKICRVWDLKGSKANRKSEPGDSVGKDLDMLEEGRRLRFAEPGARVAFLEQLRRDATFLARMGIMDYSLLLGLHNCEEERGGGGACDDVPGGGAGPSTPPAGAGGEEPPRSNTPFRRDVLQRATTAGHAMRAHDGCKALELDDGGEEPSRSNTPFRRGMLQRASTAGYAKRRNDGFEVLESSATASGDVADDIRMAKSSLTLNATPESPRPSGGETALNAMPALSRSSSDAAARVPRSAITSRSDSGIEGYGVTIGDGTLSKTREIYFCGELAGFVLLYHRRTCYCPYVPL